MKRLKKQFCVFHKSIVTESKKSQIFELPQKPLDTRPLFYFHPLNIEIMKCKRTKNSKTYISTHQNQEHLNSQESFEITAAESVEIYEC